MMPPRAQFRIRTPGFIFSKARLSIRWRVSLVSGVWTVMKSEVWITSSKEACRIPIFSARSGVR